MGGKILGLIPAPRIGNVTKIYLALMGGKILKNRIDLPMINEQALGLAVLGFMGSNEAEKRMFVEMGAALQLVEFSDLFGITNRVDNMLSNVSDVATLAVASATG